MDADETAPTTQTTADRLVPGDRFWFFSSLPGVKHGPFTVRSVRPSPTSWAPVLLVGIVEDEQERHLAPESPVEVEGSP
jgi:hypothetical protein